MKADSFDLVSLFKVLISFLHFALSQIHADFFLNFFLFFDNDVISLTCRSYLSAEVQISLRDADGALQSFVRAVDLANGKLAANGEIYNLNVLREIVICTHTPALHDLLGYIIIYNNI